MKIIYCTDIHDALKELRILLLATDADLYLLSGDILYKAFYQEETIYQFVCLQEEFWGIAAARSEKIVPFDLAQDILRHPDKYGGDEDLMLKAAEYRLLFNKAAKTMKDKYETIEELIRKYGNAECRMLPGNYDIDLRYTALEERDLHRRKVTIGGLRFAGYGGAPIATSGIPEKLSVVFHESQQDGALYSEPEDFFQESRPDVMVIHNPAYGFFDRIPGLGHVGSLGIRNYLDDHNPALVVSGHVHEDYGVCVKKNGTVLLNSSNFGGVDSAYGWQEGGSFAEISIDNGRVNQVKLNRLEGVTVHPLLVVNITNNRPHRTLFSGAQAHTSLDLSLFVRDPNGNPIQY